MLHNFDGAQRCLRHRHTRSRVTAFSKRRFARVSKSFTFTTCGRGRCSLITVIPIAGGSSVFGVWLSVDLGDQNPPSSWWVICPNVAGLGHAGKADGVEMTRSRIQLLIVLSAVIVNPSAEALWAQTPSAPPSSGNPHRVTDRDAQVRSNSVVWDQERWQPLVVDLKPEDITHLAGYNAKLSGMWNLGGLPTVSSWPQTIWRGRS